MNNQMNRRAVLGTLAVLPLVGLFETTASATKTAPVLPKDELMSQIFTKGFGTYRYDFQKVKEARVAWTAALSKSLEVPPENLSLAFPMFTEISVPNQYAADRFTGFYLAPRYAFLNSEGIWISSHSCVLSGVDKEMVREARPGALERIFQGALKEAMGFYQECNPQNLTFLGEPGNSKYMTQRTTYEPLSLA